MLHRQSIADQCGERPLPVVPQPGQAEVHGTQRATADSRVGTVSAMTLIAIGLALYAIWSRRSAR